MDFGDLSLRERPESRFLDLLEVLLVEKELFVLELLSLVCVSRAEL